MLAFLPRVGHRPRSRRRPRPLEEGLESIDVDRRAASHLPQQRERVGVVARAGCLGEGAVHPRAQLTYVRSVKQLLGPQQQPVANLDSSFLNTVSTRPASSFAFHSVYAAARSSRAVSSIARIRCA